MACIAPKIESFHIDDKRENLAAVRRFYFLLGGYSLIDGIVSKMTHLYTYLGHLDCNRRMCAGLDFKRSMIIYIGVLVMNINC